MQITDRRDDKKRSAADHRVELFTLLTGKTAIVEVAVSLSQPVAYQCQTSRADEGY